MANSYSESSTQIDFTQPQAVIAAYALEQVKETFTFNQPTPLVQAIFNNPNVDYGYAARIIRLLVEHHPEFGSVDDMFDNDLSFDFEAEPERDGLWVYGDSFNSEHAAIFIQACLDVFNLDMVVTLSVSHTCDKLCLDAFGGHMVTVTRDEIIFHVPDEPAHILESQHVNGDAYYVCDWSTQTDFGPDRILVYCKKNADISLIARMVAANERGMWAWAVSLFAPITSSLMTCNIKPVNAIEAQTLSEHLPIADYTWHY